MNKIQKKKIVGILEEALISAASILGTLMFSGILGVIFLLAILQIPSYFEEGYIAIEVAIIVFYGIIVYPIWYNFAITVNKK